MRKRWRMTFFVLAESGIQDTIVMSLLQRKAAKPDVQKCKPFMAVVSFFVTFTLPISVILQLWDKFTRGDDRGE